MATKATCIRHACNYTQGVFFHRAFFTANASNPKESTMRHTFQVQVIAVLLTAATVLATDHRLFAAGPTPPSTTKPSYPSTTTPGPIDRAYMLHPYMPQGPSPAMPMLSPQNMAAAMEKLRSLGTQIGRASMSPFVCYRATRSISSPGTRRTCYPATPRRSCRATNLTCYPATPQSCYRGTRCRS